MNDEEGLKAQVLHGISTQIYSIIVIHTLFSSSLLLNSCS